MVTSSSCGLPPAIAIVFLRRSSSKTISAVSEAHQLSRFCKSFHADLRLIADAEESPDFEAIGLVDAFHNLSGVCVDLRLTLQQFVQLEPQFPILGCTADRIGSHNCCGDFFFLSKSPFQLHSQARVDCISEIH